MKKMLIIAGIAVTAVVICLTVFLLSNKENNNGVLSWQDQYDLGIRYLNEGNYEEAIIAFNAAIEIEPNNPNGYLFLAEVYIAQNDFEKAKDILESGYAITKSQELQDRISEIESGNIKDYLGNLRKYSYFDENGILLWTHLRDYNEKNIATRITCLDANGSEVAQVTYEYDNEGKRTVDSGGYNYADGIFTRVINEYDNNGNLVKASTYNITSGLMEEYHTYTYTDGDKYSRIDYYTPDNNTTGYSLYTWNSNGKILSRISYSETGQLEYDWRYFYDANDNLVRWEGYDSSGELYSVQIHEYDSNNNEIRIIHQDGNGNITGQIDYK